MVNLDQLFPGLARSGFQVTSTKTTAYNCVAWAVGDANNWWWPVPSDSRDSYWPAGVPRSETVSAFAAALATLGYTTSGDESVEPGSEKIAIFANDHDEPLHLARQLPTGRWTSKLGELEDIEHALRDLEAEYGSVVMFLKRSTLSVR